MKPPSKPSPKKFNPKQAREDMAARAKAAPMPPLPLSREVLRPLAIRIGIPAALLWIGAFILNGPVPKIVMGVLTLILAGVLFWAYRFAMRQRRVAEIMRDGGDTAESRKEAIAKLETDFKKDASEAIFARAQLELQEDPQRALRTLETIKLDKVLGPVADQARANRAMIHLTLGETEQARLLVDAIDMSQQKDARGRATLIGIVGEAWARSGQAKRAVELLGTIDPEDPVYEDLRPQLLRARAFAFAWASDSKQMKQVLRRLAQMNPQYLMGFITRKKNPAGVNPRGVHPLLEKEAYELLTRSGAVPQKREFRRS